MGCEPALDRGGDLVALRIRAPSATSSQPARKVLTQAATPAGSGVGRGISWAWISVKPAQA